VIGNRHCVTGRDGASTLMADNAFITGITVGAAALSAVFAGIQLQWSRRDANRRLAFEHLREIETRLQKAWAFLTADMRRDILNYYRRERDDLTPGAQAFLALLNSLDLLAYGLRKKLVDSRLVDEWVKTVVSERVLSQTFLRELQKCCGDEASYEDLYAYFTKLREVDREARRKKLKEG
jgi:hypothetical protein